jgi:hypothetical protein
MIDCVVAVLPQVIDAVGKYNTLRQKTLIEGSSINLLRVSDNCLQRSREENGCRFARKKREPHAEPSFFSNGMIGQTYFE